MQVCVGVYVCCIKQRFSDLSGHAAHLSVTHQAWQVSQGL